MQSVAHFVAIVVLRPRRSRLTRALLGTALLATALSTSMALAQAHPPASILLYETLKDLLPVMHIGGVPLDVRHLCPLLARARTGTGPFLTQPDDFDGHITCDTTHVILAWSGYCDKGVRDTKGGVHWSQSHWPVAAVDTYPDGTVVIRLNNIAKLGAPEPSLEDETTAVAFLSRVASGWRPVFDVRSPGSTLFPAEWVGVFPPQKRRQ
jgi:hypothetical protein